MLVKDDSGRMNTIPSSEYKYTFVYCPSSNPPPLVPTTEKRQSPKLSSIVLPASRENIIPSQSHQIVSQPVIMPSQVMAVRRNMSNEVCLIELQSADARTDSKSVVSAANDVPESDFIKTDQSKSPLELTSSSAAVEKKSNIILPASRESLVPLQPPQNFFKAPARISQAFPTAPKVMVRKFNLAYNSQTNTHFQNKFLSKVRISDEDPKHPISENIAVPMVLNSGDVYTVNTELCNNGGKIQLIKVTPSETIPIPSHSEKPSEARVTCSGGKTTLAVVSTTSSHHQTPGSSIPIFGVPLKLVPTILKRSPANTVLAPSGLGTVGSIPSIGPCTLLKPSVTTGAVLSNGPCASAPVVTKNNNVATVATTANKPIVSLVGKSVITKDNKVFNIKIVDGKCVLYENVDSKTAAVSEVSNQPKAIKQADLKVLRTPKFIKVDSLNGGFFLKRSMRSNEVSGATAPKQANISIASEKSQTPEPMNQVAPSTSVSLEGVRSEPATPEIFVNLAGNRNISNSSSVSCDAVSDSLEWDANEILETLNRERMETENIIDKVEEQVKVKPIDEVEGLREVEIPAHKILVVDACSQTDMSSLIEPGKIVDTSISPAVVYDSGSVGKKQVVAVTPAPVAIVERTLPVHSVAPCVQEVHSQTKRAKLDVKETECLSNENKGDPKFSESCAQKEIEPVKNTVDNFDNTLWQDLLKNCSATEIEPHQLLMETESLSAVSKASDGYSDKSSVHDLIVKHNIDMLCHKNKLVKNDGPLGEEYYKPNYRRRKQTFTSSSNRKSENCVKNTEAKIEAKEKNKLLNSDNFTVNSNEVLDNPRLKSLLGNESILQKLYFEWIESVHPDSDGNIELHYAVTEENVDLVRRQCIIISARKLSVDIKNNEGETPLHLAVRNGHKEITKVLLSYGADPCVKNSKGNTALHLAVLADSVGSLRALLARNSSWILPLDVLNDEGLSPLHLCAMNNKNKQLLELLAAGASVNLEDGKSGRTALFHAVEADNNQIVRVLLAAGADSSLQNFSGHTPLHAASEVSVTTDKRVMSELITNEGISGCASTKIKKKQASKVVSVQDSDDEDNPKCVRSHRKSRDNRF